MVKLSIITSLIVLTLCVGSGQLPTASAQSGTTQTYVEDFYNRSFPPRFNFRFQHSFAQATAWDLSEPRLNDPLPPSPPYTLALYWDNEDTVTFNLTGRTYVDQAQVWGYARPAAAGIPRGRGRVIFVGTGDTKTFTFSGGGSAWQFFSASSSEAGDHGALLGQIIAVKLAKTVQASDTVLFDDLQIVTVTPPTTADLALTQSGPASPVSAGADIVYTLTVTNNGPDTAGAVTFEDELPHGVTFTAAQSSPGCAAQADVVQCASGNLAPGAQRTVTIRAHVGLNACATLRSRATVTASAYDLNLANNTAVHVATTPLPACADLSLTQTAAPVPFEAGQQYHYDLLLTNHGPDVAGATVTDTLPAGVTFIGATTSTGAGCTHSSGILTCNFGPLSVGQAGQQWVEVTLFAPTAQSGRLTNRARALPVIADPDLGNNASVFRLAYGPAYTYTLIAEAGTGPLAAFDQVYWPALNNAGRVAFIAGHPIAPDLSRQAIFSGDGGPLTSIVDITPILTVTFLYDLSINDQGQVAFVYGQPYTSVVATGNGGPLTTIVSDSLALGGVNYRRYQHVSINDAGRVVAQYIQGPSNFLLYGITSFEAGVETPIRGSGPSTRYSEIDQSNREHVAFMEWDRSNIGGSLWLAQIGGPAGAVTFQQAAQAPYPYARLVPGMEVNDDGAVVFCADKIDTTTGWTMSGFYHSGFGLSAPLFARHGIPGHVLCDQPALNDRGRFAFNGYPTLYGREGIFTGENPVAHKVIARNDALFGSRAGTVFLPAKDGLNNAGQVVFQAFLTNGRELIVRADPVFDNDLDGVSDYLENGAGDSSGDGNHDGIPDSAQLNVTSLPNDETGRYVTFETDPSATLVNVDAIPNPAPGNSPPDTSFPIGHFAFRVQDVAAGGAVTVTLFPGTPIMRYYKYGRTPNNPSPHWYAFTYDGTTGAEIFSDRVVLHFVDGQRGDDDLAVNSVIVDPGSPAGYPFAAFLPITLRN